MAADDVDFASKGQKKGFGAKVRSCCNSIWNPQKKELLGRTGGSWAKISLFYIVFYSCLAGFFAIMMVGFFSTLDDTKPTMQNMYSLIKQNPGMGFRPMVDKESTLVKFNNTDPDTYADKIKNIIEFLTDNNYIDKDTMEPIDDPKVDGENKPLFQFDAHGVCGINNTNVNGSFGYSSGSPCVLLKINRVINWMPESVDFTTDLGKEANASVGERLTNNSVGVSCEGENDADVDNLGEVEFYPSEGFSFDYFPYTNAADYRAPIVFAKFPNAKPGVVIQVWCKLWEKNIKHHKNDKGGSVHFELLVDKLPPK